MINKENFKDLLQLLGFTNSKKEYIKVFKGINSYLKVDFKNEILVYPEDRGLKVNERQTCNFLSNENFVVFECVNRLFEKGYKPSHIELEPKWKIGHGASGGRADILVKDNNKPLLIIECKTPGREFEKAWKDTLVDGDQLFSYTQQIHDVEYLCLYTSNIEEETCKYTSFIISHKDNLKILEDNKSLRSFEKAKNVKERYNVWKDTYKLEYNSNGIFEENIQAYHIGKEKYTLSDLHAIDAQSKEGKYHEFRTILRKHNVSGRENAFDVLVNLFLCKIVDETQNANDIKFYWKGIAYDNYFDLIDRLQELHKIGMDKFLNQEIIYISNKEIDEAFWTVKQNNNSTKQQIKNYFRQLKFYTNSDFGFLDVHNERLFYQNAKVLLEVVKLWQDLRITTKEPNQFLGDMFEFFLDNGIKQSEGQFFTPMPICKFILMSLPLENIIKTHTERPKTLDYSCGAGHFLTEYATQITPFIKKYKNGNLHAFFKEIYGIEKEYRLSKVAKLSSFMYGHEGIEILHNDALDNHTKIKDSSFDILVANPPFSVDGFLDTLSENMRNKYQLTDTISDITRNGNIECFFIERAKMLLAPSGVAGIIIPAAILSNTDNTHSSTREILLKYFDIVALVELGRSTFSKTPANTVVLFLRRKGQKPEPAEHFKNRVDDWFIDYDDDKESEIYEDKKYLQSYCNYINIPFKQYKTLLDGSPNEELLEYEIFKEYKYDFNNTTEVRKIREKVSSKNYTVAFKDDELKRKFIKYVTNIEKEKLYFYILAYTNPQKVLVVRSPEDTKPLKQFRGYEWSGAKGNEGIKYNGGDTIEEIVTPLFDPLDRYNTSKINYLIQQNYLGKEIKIDKSLNEGTVSTVDLVDLLRFKDRKFDKRIWLSTEQTIAIKSKYDLVRLDNVCTIVRGASPRPIDKFITTSKDGINWIKIGDVNENDKYIVKTAEKITKEGAENSRYVKEGDFILSNSMSFGRPYILKISGCIHDGWLLMTDFRKDLNKDYLFEILSYEDTQLQFSHSAAGGVVKNLNKERVSSTKIPLPPKSVQDAILKEVSKFEANKNKLLKNISLRDYEETVKRMKNDILRKHLQ